MSRLPRPQTASPPAPTPDRLRRDLAFGLRGGVLSCLLWLALGAAAALAEPVAVPFDSPRWKIQGDGWRIEEHLGRQSLFLPQGKAWLDDVEILDGAIEFDVAFTPQRGFCGALFRLQSPVDHEHFYLRPHQSGRPDASQYTPVFDGISGWQLYHGEGYGTALDFPDDRWIHVRVVFAGGRAEVFVDSDEPVVYVDELKRAPRSGRVGVDNNGADAHFSNFRYERLERPTLREHPKPERPAAEGTVKTWQVSSRFDEARLAGHSSLPAELVAELEWQELVAEPTGITNLARLSGARPGADTVIARVRLRASRAVTLPVRFGYSDRVRVFLDGRGLYAGTNLYRSRDERYLGTIGLFDGVWLTLEPGEHELAFAVSEAFGGWGILAALGASEGGGAVEILARP